MTDTLRDRIAAAIAAHEPVTDYSGADGECIECDLNPRWPDSEAPTGPTAGWKRHATHLADAILAIPGIAVVELPEPDRGGGYGDDGVGWGTDNNSVFTSGGMVYDQCGEFSPAQAREIGLRWLAAADYTERDQ